MPSANNCCVVDRKVKRVNPKCYLHKENPCFHVIGLYEKMGVSLSYCVISLCKSEHRAVHCKLIRWCMSSTQ